MLFFLLFLLLFLAAAAAGLATAGAPSYKQNSKKTNSYRTSCNNSRISSNGRILCDGERGNICMRGVPAFIFLTKPAATKMLFGALVRQLLSQQARPLRPALVWGEESLLNAAASSSFAMYSSICLSSSAVSFPPLLSLDFSSVCRTATSYPASSSLYLPPLSLQEQSLQLEGDGRPQQRQRLLEHFQQQQQQALQQRAYKMEKTLVTSSAQHRSSWRNFTLPSCQIFFSPYKTSCVAETAATGAQIRRLRLSCCQGGKRWYRRRPHRPAVASTSLRDFSAARFLVVASSTAPVVFAPCGFSTGGTHAGYRAAAAASPHPAAAKGGTDCRLFLKSVPLASSSSSRGSLSFTSSPSLYSSAFASSSSSSPSPPSSSSSSSCSLSPSSSSSSSPSFHPSSVSRTAAWTPFRRLHLPGGRQPVRAARAVALSSSTSGPSCGTKREVAAKNAGSFANPSRSIGCCCSIRGRKTAAEEVRWVPDLAQPLGLERRSTSATGATPQATVSMIQHVADKAQVAAGESEPAVLSKSKDTEGVYAVVDGAAVASTPAAGWSSTAAIASTAAPCPSAAAARAATTRGARMWDAAAAAVAEKGSQQLQAAKTLNAAAGTREREGKRNLKPPEGRADRVELAAAAAGATARTAGAPAEAAALPGAGAAGVALTTFSRATRAAPEAGAWTAARVVARKEEAGEGPQTEARRLLTAEAVHQQSGTGAPATVAAAGAAAVAATFRQMQNFTAACSSNAAAARATVGEDLSAWITHASAVATPERVTAVLEAAAAAMEKSERRRAEGVGVKNGCNSQLGCFSCPSACWSVERVSEEEQEVEDGQHERGRRRLGASAAGGEWRDAAAAGGIAAAHPAKKIGGFMAAAASSSAADAAPPQRSPAAECESGSSEDAAAAAAGKTGKTATGENEGQEANDVGEKELLTEKLRARMEKQGYKLIGTHSAVKLCRWTKKQLQGLGGCYKHTFYGIESHRCMEATTSLVCSNRCVFCWRHHTHPASKRFRWKADPPGEVLTAAIAAHKAMIKPLNGMQGVKAAAYEEALQPRHCALSLIGEALMYPHINAFLQLLHNERISSFLVMNGQHPELLARLAPVTQLYVSVDAPNERALKAVDRPLFADFWRRLLYSLDVLREKKERTVVRMTLIKDINDEDVEGYARLIERGRPNFVEVKGMTFAGSSKTFKLSLRNTPHMEETISFSQRLLAALRRTDNRASPAPGAAAAEAPTFESCGSGSTADPASSGAPNYQLAALHEHTNSVLIADATKFFCRHTDAGKSAYMSEACAPCAESLVQISPQNGQREANTACGIAAAKEAATSCATVSARLFSGAEAIPLSNADHDSHCTQPSTKSRHSDSKNVLFSSQHLPGGETAPGGEERGSALHYWHTHIDFKRFFELSDHQKHAEDYSAKTPAWASLASPLRGFDPRFNVARYLRQIAGRPTPAAREAAQEASSNGNC